MIQKIQKEKLKYVLQIALGIILLTSVLFLVLGQSGKELQVKWLGTYVPVEATAEKIFVTFNGPGARGVRYHTFVSVAVSYRVENQSYTATYVAKSLVPFDDDEGAALFTKQFVHEGDPLTIYYDPDDPNQSVLHAEDEVHFGLIFLLVLPGLTLSVLLILNALMNLFISKASQNRESLQ
jgi:hypothetical protein